MYIGIYYEYRATTTTQLLLRMSRSYGVVWNSPAAYWRLYWTWKFLLPVCFKWIYHRVPTCLVQEMGSL